MIEECFISCFVFSEFYRIEKVNTVKMIRFQLARPKCIRTNFSYVDFVYLESRLFVENIRIYFSRKM